MDTVTFSVKLGDIVWGLGVIVLVGSAWKTLTERLPLFKRTREIRALQDAQNKLCERQTALETAQSDTNEAYKVLCRGVQCLLQHARTGNNKEQIIQCEQNIDEFLVNR
jgi:hypothetical protein